MAYTTRGGQTPAAYPHNDNRPWFSVNLPDFFVSFFSVKPKFNPNYKTVGRDSEAYIADVCSLGDETYRKKLLSRASKINLSHFSGIAIPDADPDALRTFCDWANWLVPWDDMFDDGPLKDDSIKARAVVDRLLSDMSTTTSAPTQHFTPEIEALLMIHKSIWTRVLARSSPATARRFAKAITDYSRANLEQVDHVVFSATPDPETYIATRRRAVAFAPGFALVECVYGLEIPRDVMECKAMRTLNRIALDFAAIHNDALSYSKEQSSGVPHNLVAVYRMAGYTAQESYDKIDGLLRTRYRDWFLAQADLPQWGEEIDRQVQTYLRGIQSVVVANLNWSLTTMRYFGVHSEQVRKTRLIDVLPCPPARHDEGVSVLAESMEQLTYGIHTPVLEQERGSPVLEQA